MFPREGTACGRIATETLTDFELEVEHGRMAPRAIPRTVRLLDVYQEGQGRIGSRGPGRQEIRLMGLLQLFTYCRVLWLDTGEMV